MKDDYTNQPSSVDMLRKDTPDNHGPKADVPKTPTQSAHDGPGGAKHAENGTKEEMKV